MLKSFGQVMQSIDTTQYSGPHLEKASGKLFQFSLMEIKLLISKN